MHELPEISRRGHAAEPQEDFRIRPPLTDAGYGTRSGDRLRQGFGDRPFRSGERSDPERGRTTARPCGRGHIRPCGRSSKDGPTYVADKADHGVRAADTIEIAQMEQTR